MSGQEGVAITMVFLGFGAGAVLVAQRPSFWIEFGCRLGKALLPLAWRYVSRRMPPEEEGAGRQAERRSWECRAERAFAWRGEARVR